MPPTTVRPVFFITMHGYHLWKPTVLGISRRREQVQLQPHIAMPAELNITYHGLLSVAASHHAASCGTLSGEYHCISQTSAADEVDKHAAASCGTVSKEVRHIAACGVPHRVDASFARPVAAPAAGVPQAAPAAVPLQLGSLISQVPCRSGAFWLPCTTVYVRAMRDLCRRADTSDQGRLT